MAKRFGPYLGGRDKLTPMVSSVKFPSSLSSVSMKIAIAQLNCIVGDLSGNVQKIRAAAQAAKQQGAQILLTPELSLTGYPPEDLLLREDFYQASESALQALT